MTQGNRLDPAERRAIVRIRTAEPRQRGTGFVVGPGLVLTAYHVVGDRQAGRMFEGANTLEFKGEEPVPYEPVADAADPVADWALLRAAVPEDVVPLRLSTVGKSDRDFYGFGFPEQQPIDGQRVEGTIRDALAELRGVPAIQVFCEDFAAGGGGLAEGASGGPVLIDGRVVGLFRFTLTDEGGRSRGTLYACPATAVHGHLGLAVEQAPEPFLGDLSPEAFERVRAATGIVEWPAERPTGRATGWLAAPGWMATASDRLAELPLGSAVRVLLHSGTFEATLQAVDDDGGCVLIRLGEGPAGVAPLDTAVCDAPGALWVAQGFPVAHGTVAVQILGTIGRTNAVPLGLGSDAAPMLELRSEEFGQDAESLAGVEGAPVLVRGAVVGHLRAPGSLQRGYATGADRVRALLDRTGDGEAAGELGRVSAPAPEPAALPLPELGEGEHHVALCYGRGDKEWGTALGRRLEGAGFRVLFDGLGADDDDLTARTTRLGRARSSVVVLSPEWAAAEEARALDAALLGLQAARDDFRVVAALVGETPVPELWQDRPGIRFDGPPSGAALERLEHALLGVEAPRPGTPEAVALRTRTGPADEMIRAVGSVKKGNAPHATGTPDVHAAETAGELRVLELWDEWREAGADGDTSVPLAVAESLIRLGHPKRAIEVLDQVGDGTRARQLRGLALSEVEDRLDDAIEILQKLYDEGQRESETTGILAGRLKRRWLATDRRADLRAAHRLYLEDFEHTGEPYTGINAAFSALGLGRGEDSERLARAVLERVEAVPEAERSAWDAATLGEAHLLLGRVDEARRHYQEAVDARPNAVREHVVMRLQARLELGWLELPEDALDDLFDIPRVAAFVGHMTDSPDRPEPRLPADRLPVVGRRIREALREHRIAIGYSSAARGSDLLFLEAMVERGGESNVILPFPRATFRETSVGDDEGPVFDRIFERERVHAHELLDADPGDEEERVAAYVRCNEEIAARARARARTLDEQPVLVYVWDGKGGDGPGGTADLVRSWKRHGYPEVHVPLDP